MTERKTMADHEKRATFAAAWVEVQKACGAMDLDSENPHFKYRYTSEAAMKAKVGPALSEHGFAIFPRFEIIGGLTSEKFATVRLVLRVIHAETGWEETFEGIGSGADGQDKAIAKACTQAWKIALTAALSIARGQDPDADAPQKEPAREPERRERAGSPASRFGGVRVISDGQRKRLWAILASRVEEQVGEDAEGKSDTKEAVLRHVLRDFGLESSKDIDTDIYDGIVDRCAKFDLAELGTEPNPFDRGEERDPDDL